MRVYLVLSQNIVVVFSRIFIGIWETTSVAAGKNVRGTQGSLKRWSKSLNKCEKFGKKAKYAVFCGSD